MCSLLFAPSCTLIPKNSCRGWLSAGPGSGRAQSSRGQCCWSSNPISGSRSWRERPRHRATLRAWPAPGSPGGWASSVRRKSREKGTVVLLRQMSLSVCHSSNHFTSCSHCTPPSCPRAGLPSLRTRLSKAPPPVSPPEHGPDRQGAGRDPHLPSPAPREVTPVPVLVRLLGQPRGPTELGSPGA